MKSNNHGNMLNPQTICASLALAPNPVGYESDHCWGHVLTDAAHEDVFRRPCRRRNGPCGYDPRVHGRWPAPEIQF